MRRISFLSVGRFDFMQIFGRMRTQNLTIRRTIRYLQICRIDQLRRDDALRAASGISPSKTMAFRQGNTK